MTLPFSITPSPSGPPRCKQTLSIARIVPLTFETQSIFSPQGTSFTSLTGGRSDGAPILVNSAIGNEQSALGSQHCDASLQATSRQPPTEILRFAQDDRCGLPLRSRPQTAVTSAARSAQSSPGA